jgi:hypothetical protein
MVEQFKLGQFEKFGRNGDDTIAHVATGERVIPEEILNAELTKKINSRMESLGLDPNRYIVGHQANSLNPVTGRPEFFLGSIKKGLFGKKGSTKELKRIRDEAVSALEDTSYSTPSFTDPLTTITTSREGIDVAPSELVAGLTGAFGDQFTQQLGRMGTGADELRAAYEPFPYTRQELQNIFTAGLPSAENALAARTGSTLGKILGGRGISTGSAGAMAGAQREADIASQALRQQALAGASNLYDTGMTQYARNLAQAQALRQGDVGMLTALGNAQLGPLSELYRRAALPLGLGQQLTQFDLGKIQNMYNVQLPLAQQKARDTSGLFSSGGNVLGGLFNAGMMGAGLASGLGWSPFSSAGAAAAGGGGGLSSAISALNLPSGSAYFGASSSPLRQALGSFGR